MWVGFLHNSIYKEAYAKRRHLFFADFPWKIRRAKCICQIYDKNYKWSYLFCISKMFSFKLHKALLFLIELYTLVMYHKWPHFIALTIWCQKYENVAIQNCTSEKSGFCFLYINCTFKTLLFIFFLLLELNIKVCAVVVFMTGYTLQD